jgi:hypothetical protein
MKKEKRLKKETKHQRSPSEPYKLGLNSQTRNPLNSWPKLKTGAHTPKQLNVGRWNHSI